MIPPLWVSYPTMMSPTTEKRSRTWHRGTSGITSSWTSARPRLRWITEGPERLKMLPSAYMGRLPQVSSDLSWSVNTTHLVKKAQQHPLFLRKLKRTGLSSQLLTSLYRATTESIPWLSVTAGYSSCTAQDKKDLTRVVETAQGTVGCRRPDLDSVLRYLSPKKGQTHCDRSHPPGQHTVYTASIRKMAQEQADSGRASSSEL